ncbi:hypothetical protein [Piscinibacterium candidicorallinum]|uniref:ParB/Sulfiredoxin domain-containing protein n=1 Tax=Piscinibacterium candidicorallinum TaxID=1793872 RepID=A0ABV7H110_9BURK
MSKSKPDAFYEDSIALTRIHLDPENVRHDPINDEAKIIGQLTSIEKVLELAKDIAEKGSVSPLDRIGVIEMDGNPGHYIAVEGNRRTCALKLLHDPRKAPTKKLEVAFSTLKQDFNVPTKLPVVVFSSREAARPWLSLRHLGEQDGVGTRPWNPSAKNRYAKGDTPDQLAVAVLDRAQAAGWIDSSQRKEISVTTLTRYLKNPVVRATLGLASASQLKFTHDAEEVDAALRQFLSDARPQGNKEAILSSRTKVAERLAYAQSLHDTGIAPKTRLPAPSDPPPPQPRDDKKPRNPVNPDKRATIAKSSFVSKHPDKNLQRLLIELRKLRPDDGFYFSANYLVRAVIERVLVLYAIDKGFHRSGIPDHHLVKLCHEHLEKNGVPQNQVKIMRTAASNKDALYSLDTLGSAVHGAHVPTRASLIAVWDNWEPCLRLMLDRIN